MRTIAVICEFDPMHRGHEHLIQRARAEGDARIVCIMSGEFCQRSEPCAIPKHTRAHAALRAGADLVLELPFPFSCGSAEFFALGAMSVIEALGCVDTLAFGCESGDAAQLCEAAARMCSGEFMAEFERLSCEHSSLGSAAMIESCYTSLYGESEIFKGPNNVLALEYIKAAHRMSLPLSTLAIKRRGDGHGDTSGEGEFVSASFIRGLLRSGERDIARYLPDSSQPLLSEILNTTPTSLEYAQRAILAHLRLSQIREDTAELGGGVGRRLFCSAQTADSLCALISSAKTKKYTNARLRRAIIYSMCAVTERDLRTAPAYTTLLGANEVGCALLSEIKKTRKIPIVSTPSMLGELGEECDRSRTLHKSAAALYSLCCREMPSADAPLRIPPVIIK